MGFQRLDLFRPCFDQQSLGLLHQGGHRRHNRPMAGIIQMVGAQNRQALPVTRGLPQISPRKGCGIGTRLDRGPFIFCHIVQQVHSALATRHGLRGHADQPKPQRQKHTMRPLTHLAHSLRPMG